MTAGFGDIDMDGKYVAIKMHFGEPGNLAYLRPNWARAVADLVKSHGGKPFLTDCNTLYVGGRKNALDHIESAYVNGFTPYSTGCHILIADGLKGNDEVEVPVEGGEYVKAAKIGRAVMDADVFISLTHFKGHEQAGMGGALKNIGMGCGSRAGKMEQHNSGKPFVKQKKCIGCRACAKICAHGAPQFGEDGKATIDTDKCVGCARCIAVCPKDAIECLYDEAPAILNKKIAEYTKAVVDGRPCFHVSLVVDVSPNCDCHGENDVPIVPDVGMFASFDPVALDQACADAVLAQTPCLQLRPVRQGLRLHGQGLLPRRPPGHRLGRSVWSTRRRSASAPGITSSSKSESKKKQDFCKSCFFFCAVEGRSCEQGVELLHHAVGSGVGHQHHEIAVGDDAGLILPHLCGRRIPGAAGGRAVAHLIVDPGLEDVLHRLDVAAVLHFHQGDLIAGGGDHGHLHQALLGGDGGEAGIEGIQGLSLHGHHTGPGLLVAGDRGRKGSQVHLGGGALRRSLRCGAGRLLSRGLGGLGCRSVVCRRLLGLLRGLFRYLLGRLLGGGPLSAGGLCAAGGIAGSPGAGIGRAAAGLTGICVRSLLRRSLRILRRRFFLLGLLGLAGGVLRLGGLLGGVAGLVGGILRAAAGGQRKRQRQSQQSCQYFLLHVSLLF